MSRREARLRTSIWRDPDVLALPAHARYLYVFLISQPDLSLCGLLPLRLAPWSEDIGLPIAEVSRSLDALVAARFVVVDRDRAEVWIRTEMRHDNVLASAKTRAGAQASLRCVTSRRILVELGLEYPELISEWGLPTETDPPSDGVSDTPSDGGCSDYGDRGLGIGDRGEEGIGVWGKGGDGEPETALAVTPGPVPRRTKVSRDAQVESVFTAWKEAGHLNGRTVLTADRRRAVLKRLEEGYEAEDAVAAAEGIWQDEWHRDNGRTDLIYAMRQIERYRDIRLGLLSGAIPDPMSSSQRSLKRRLESGQTTPDRMARLLGLEGDP